MEYDILQSKTIKLKAVQNGIKLWCPIVKTVEGEMSCLIHQN